MYILFRVTNRKRGLFMAKRKDRFKKLCQTKHQSDVVCESKDVLKDILHSPSFNNYYDKYVMENISKQKSRSTTGDIPDSSEYFCEPITQKNMINTYKTSNPTDRFFIDKESLLELSKIFKTATRKTNVVYVPSDLIYAEMIPLENIEMVFTGNDGTAKYRCQVAIDNAYLDTLKKDKKQNQLEQNTNIISRIGMVRIYLEEGGFLLAPLLVPSDPYNFNAEFLPTDENEMWKSNMIISPICCGYISSTAKKKIMDTYDMMVLRQVIFARILQYWYSIQIALLHPVVKEVFTSSQPNNITEVNHDDSSSTERKNRKLSPRCYVKTHVITKKLFDDIEKKQRKFTRKALSWYVIGHWRHYKNGKSIFIKPYWKGVLRETKKVETHSREILVEDNMVTE